MDLLFTNNVTQVVEYYHQSKKMFARRTEREINRINGYEKKWKIKTSRHTFKILPVSESKPEQIKINNVDIPSNDSITVLGLKIKRTGIVNTLMIKEIGQN